MSEVPAKLQTSQSPGAGSLPHLCSHVVWFNRIYRTGDASDTSIRKSFPGILKRRTTTSAKRKLPVGLKFRNPPVIDQARQERPRRVKHVQPAPLQVFAAHSCVGAAKPLAAMEGRFGNLAGESTFRFVESWGLMSSFRQWLADFSFGAGQWSSLSPAAGLFF